MAVAIFEKRDPPFRGSILQPGQELVGNLRQSFSGHPPPLAVGVEETEHTLRLLERLDQAVEQQPIKTPIAELDTLLVVLHEGVHSAPLSGEIPRSIARRERLLSPMATSKPARTFEDLRVWQKAHRFVLAVYGFTATFPQHETYGLSLQMRRAAVSIPANIAEGFRQHHSGFWLLTSYPAGISRAEPQTRSPHGGVCRVTPECIEPPHCKISG